jgi:hypothetical protein
VNQLPRQELTESDGIGEGELLRLKILAAPMSLMQSLVAGGADGPSLEN